MPIDVTVKGSPGWWLLKLARKLEARQPRLHHLDLYLRGDPPLPEGAENMRDAYKRFQKKSRTNFAELIVESRRERMKPAGFRTAAGGDPNGDLKARKIWDDNGMDVEFPDTLELMLGLGDGYAIVGGIDPETGSPVITGEDPRQVVTIHDPAQQRKIRAAAKLFHDDDEDLDLAYLYLPADPTADRETAEVWVARREVNRGPSNRRIRFNATTWEWDEERTSKLPHTRVPVVRFRNRRGVGEFEQHIDLLDRFNHMTLSRMVIAAMQAYRQRALKNAPETDDDGNEIDYEGIFAADPGAMWLLPDEVELWESQQTDLTPILTAGGKDIELISAVGKVPLSQFTPSAMPQTAEGASLAKEGLVFVCEDRIVRASEGLKDLMSLAFLVLGDEERANRSQLEVLWVPPERSSLAERADAASKVKDVIPKRTLRTDVLQFPPVAVERMEVEDAQEAFDELSRNPEPTPAA